MADWYNPASLAAIPWRPARSTRKTYVTAQDWFCGLGGTAQALMAAGVQVLVAGNHDPLAIDVHAANFPGVEHVQHDITEVKVSAYPTTDIGVFTSECTFLTNSNSTGIQGMDGQLLLWEDAESDVRVKAERSRSLMKEVLRFTEYHRYAVVFVENVIGIYRWANFRWWVGEMEKMGYIHQPIIFNSQFAPAYPMPVPQSRDRYYGVFIDPRKVRALPDLDIRPPATCSTCGAVAAVQRWKKQSRQYGDWNRSYIYTCPLCHQELRPHFTPAASAIDFSLPTVAIGERAEVGKKPLTATTMERIRVGIGRFGSRPLVVETVFSHSTSNRARSVDEPTPTLTTRQSLMLACPFMVDLRGTSAGQLPSTARPLSEPVSTICASGAHHMVVVPPEADQSFTVQYYGTGTATAVTEPIPTLTSRDRHCLVTPGSTPDILDWRTRMLDPDRELKIMMGFPPQYILKGTKRQRTALIGRSLNPATVTEILRRCIEVLA
jgi:DNA (cytosine-5)-methyltransferase 1